MKDFSALTEHERDTIAKIKAELDRFISIPCTGYINIVWRSVLKILIFRHISDSITFTA